MTGILLFFVAVIWLAFVIWLSKTITSKFAQKWWRIPIALLVIVVLLPLPLIDEIVGGRQFERLCKENSTIQVDRATAAGKTVYLARTPDTDIKGTWVRIVLQPRRFVDAATGQILVSFNDLIAVGGRLIRMLGISEGSMPLTFKGWCHPGDQYALEKLLNDLNITVIRRPEISKGDTK